METILKDMQYATRAWLKRPGLAAICVLTLALGISVNTAIFSVVNAVILRPLPYQDPDGLVMIWETMAGNDRRSVAPGNFVDWRDQNRTFSELAATFYGSFNLTGDGEPERINGSTVTSNMMSLLGVKAQLGRAFQSDDDLQDRSVVLISDGLWRRRFASERNIAGRTLTIDEAPYTIVGVMPQGFQFPVQSDLWVLGRDRNAVSMSLISQFPANDWSHERDAHFLSVIGRLKPATSLSQAQSDIAAITSRLEQNFPGTNAGLGSNVVQLHTQIVGNVKQVLFVLLGAVGLVLLISCTNVANLLLARVTQRDREIAIRLAVGATRWRLVRQLLVESLLLSVCGGLVGFFASIWLVDLFVKLSPGDIPRIGEAGVDFRLLSFTAALTMLTGIAFGSLPAFHATRTNLNSSLKEGGTKISSGRQRRSARNALVVAEVALAQVLVVGAGLLVTSYLRLSRINPGFNPDNVLTAKLAPSAKKYPDQPSRIKFYSNVLDHLERLPGVKSVGMVMNLPLSGSSMNRGFRVEGRPQPRPDENVSMDYQVVSAGYLATLEIPVIRGRAFTDIDTENSERVILINQAMAKRYWPNEDPVGKRIAIGESSKDTSWHTIVGIVGDVRHASLSERAVPCAFTLYRQDLESWARMAFVIKSDAEPAALTSAVRRELVQVDPTQPVYAIEPMEKLLGSSVASRRFIMLLTGLLSLVALGLAMVGVYGVISFSVSERTQEIGIRIALGARRRDVVTMVLGQGMTCAVLGVLIGLGGAFVVTRLLASLLFDVTPTDPITFSVVAVLLVLVAALACYLPARRATKIDPMLALRCE